jgi:hypothetical protein
MFSYLKNLGVQSRTECRPWNIRPQLAGNAPTPPHPPKHTPATPLPTPHTPTQTPRHPHTTPPTHPHHTPLHPLHNPAQPTPTTSHSLPYHPPYTHQPSPTKPHPQPPTHPLLPPHNTHPNIQPTPPTTHPSPLFQITRPLFKKLIIALDVKIENFRTRHSSETRNFAISSLRSKNHLEMSKKVYLMRRWWAVLNGNSTFFAASLNRDVTFPNFSPHIWVRSAP